MTSNVTSISSVPKLSLLVPHSLLSFRAAWNSSLFFSSVHYSCSVLSDCLWPNGLQHARPPYPSPTPGVYSNSCPLSRWCHSTISSSVVPSPPALSLSQHQGLFQWVSSLHQVAKVLEFQLQLKKKKQTKPFTLVNNLSGMGFCLRREIEVTFFFCVDLNWPSIIYWQDHPFSSLLWCQHGEKSSDHMHMNCSRTLFCSIGLSTIVTTPHRLIILH